MITCLLVKGPFIEEVPPGCRSSRALRFSANGQDVANLVYGFAVVGLDDHDVWDEVLLPRAAEVCGQV